MKDKVVIKSFSDNVQISSQQFDINEYYDMNLPQIDDSDYIIKHKINRVEQHFYSDSGYILRINYYNTQGIPYKFEEIENGSCTAKE